MKQVGLVTCMELPEPDVDQDLLLKRLRDDGIDANIIAWDDPSADPGSYDLCVLRSTWNYHLQPDNFLRWIDRAATATRLMNPGTVVRDNLHKYYLKRLRDAGVRIIPTVWFSAGESPDLGAIMDRERWDLTVVKPAVSASSYRTRRFSRADLSGGRTFLSELCAGCDVMVQEYMPAVETTGERAIVWIDGEITHAIRKNPRFDGGMESVSQAVPVSEPEREVAHAAIDAFMASYDGRLQRLTDTLLYARIDLVADQEGRVVVSELELIEPSLFLRQHPAAAGKLSAGIKRLLNA